MNILIYSSLFNNIKCIIGIIEKFEYSDKI